MYSKLNEIHIFECIDTCFHMAAIAMVYVKRLYKGTWKMNHLRIHSNRSKHYPREDFLIDRKMFPSYLCKVDS